VPQKIKIASGQTADIWTGVNVTGKVNLAVRTRDGKNELTLWWIKWGVGSAEQLGHWGPNGSLDIPISWWRGIVSAKLRGQAASDTVVYISERAAVDKTWTFDW
jgi:hypothetical protein